MAQYSRCGCQTECPCVLVGGKGIEVTGTGNVDDPYVIATDGTMDCTLAMGCVCAAAGPGMQCANGKFGTFISADRPNNMSFGTDGGLKSSCDCIPDPQSCDRTIAHLDAQIAAGQFIWGTMQGSRNLVPYGDMRSFDFAAAVRTPINADWVSTVNGCAAGIAPYPTFSSYWIYRPHQINSQRGSDFYGEGLEYNEVNPAQWLGFTKNVGSFPDFSQKLGAGKEAFDHPYYDTGMGTRWGDGALLLSDVYGKYNHKMVNALFITNRSTYASIIKTVEWWCEQTSTILFHWNPANIPYGAGHNIDLGICAFPGPKASAADLKKYGYYWNGNYTDQLATQAAAAGAKWAAVSMRLTDAQIRTFPAAGLKTFGFDTARQADFARMKRLGLIGAFSDDMVYQRAIDTANTEAGCFQRPGWDSWGTAGPMFGQVHPPQNTSAFRNKRGYPRFTDRVQGGAGGSRVGCWHLPPNFGDYDASEENKDSLPALLIGQMSNHPNMKNPQGYRVSYLAGWVNDTESIATDLGASDKPPANPYDNVSKFGIFLCAPTDDNISGPKAQNKAQGYFFFVRANNGQLVIGMRDTDTNYRELGATTVSGTTKRLGPNDMYRFHVFVYPDRLEFRANLPGTDPPPLVVRGANATKFRPPNGGYLFIAKEELEGPRFEARFGDLYVTKDLTP